MAIFSKIKNSGKAGSGARGTSSLKDYLEQEQKTELELITTFNCSLDWANDFENTRQVMGTSNSGAIHTHYTLSFSTEDDITPLEAHKFAEKLIESFDKFKDYEIALVTHKDTQHAHSHIVVNQTKMTLSQDNNIKKYHLSREEQHELKSLMQEMTRGINRERALTGDREQLIDTRIDTKPLSDRIAERGNKKELRVELEQKISDIFNKSKNLKNFEKSLKKEDIEMRFDKKRGRIKFRTLGDRRFLLGDKMQDERFSKENFSNEIERKEQEIDLYQDLKDRFERFEQNLEEDSYLYTSYEIKEKLKEYKQDLLEEAERQDKDVYERLKQDFEPNRDLELEL